MKKTNNKGFSLVELIVVVAIMAVLMVVVGPQMLRYVEKTRAQKDDSAVHELQHVVEIAVAEEDIFKEVNSKSDKKVEIEVTSGAIADADNDCPKLLAEAVASFEGGAVTFESSTYSGKTYTITVEIVSDLPKVTGAWN